MGLQQVVFIFHIVATGTLNIINHRLYSMFTIPKYFFLFTGLTNLEYLNLDSCRIGDDGLANLTGLHYV